MRGSLFEIAFILAAGALSVVSTTREAAACSPPVPKDPIVLPRPGATNVPTLADVVVVKSQQAPLVSLATAAGAPVMLGPVNLVAQGYDAVTSTSGQVYRIRPMQDLAPNTEHVVKVDGVERARFTTGAGYGKPAGVAPIVNGATFTRVRYPLSEIASGNCVFSEYAGFATFDWTLGTFPDTPSESTVHLMTISAKTGGQDESFVWIGTTPWPGVPATGAHPDPVGLWQPILDPTREYCFSVSAFPYGEAVLPMQSASVCAAVAEKSTPGAADASSGGGGGGCGIGRGEAGGGAIAIGVAIAARGLFRRACEADRQ